MTMPEAVEKIYALEDVATVAAELAKLCQDCSVITFEGPLGAGKTTVIRELLRALGVTQPVTSPTFTYLHVYEDGQGRMFYHFDLYRLGSLDEFLAAGFDEHLNASGSVILVEWPAVIEPLLDERVCRVTLDYHPESDKRVLRLTRGV